MAPGAAPIAIFGGTFDPIHFGHLRSALELVEALALAELRFMPAAEPPHRAVPRTPAAHRAAMLELAIDGEPRLSCDRRELSRPGPSYSVLSLRELRQELGGERPICLVLGADALAGLTRWYHWEELFELAHLLALARPGWEWAADDVSAALLRERRRDAAALRTQPAGALVLEHRLRPWDISATAIRGLLQSGRSARYLLPERVLDYIDAHGLYRGQSEKGE